MKSLKKKLLDCFCGSQQDEAHVKPATSVFPWPILSLPFTDSRLENPYRIFNRERYSDKELAKQMLLLISKRALEMANDEETFKEPAKTINKDLLKSEGIGGFVSDTKL